MLLDLIKKRRSVRNYLDRPIPKEDILKCIEAARLAPSACNGQPWDFIIVDNPELKNKVAGKAFSGMHSINKFAMAAPVLIVVISEKEKFFSAIGGRLKGTKYYLLDVGIACEHLVLQAAELGIGSCWIGWFNQRKVKSVSKIPWYKKVDVIISLGYSKNRMSPVNTRKSQEEISSFNKYNKK